MHLAILDSIHWTSRVPSCPVRSSTSPSTAAPACTATAVLALLPRRLMFYVLQHLEVHCQAIMLAFMMHTVVRDT